MIFVFIIQKTIYLDNTLHVSILYSMMNLFHTWLPKRTVKHLRRLKLLFSTESNTICRYSTQSGCGIRYLNDINQALNAWSG